MAETYYSSPPVPSASVRGGVLPDTPEPGTVTFVFYAPFKPFVSLVGDFNQWDTRRHPLLSNGQGMWWITLEDPGPTRYGYYVAIDEQAHTWVADPYAREVRWADGDADVDRDGNADESSGENVRESDVWAYWPGTEAHAAQSPLREATGEQAWQTPALRDLVIYELCVRDFGGEWRGNHPHYGQFDDILPRLDYLAQLGINAIELMPIQAFPGKSSWGYNPVFYFAPAEVYGRPADFRRLVAACHARGMAVLLDVAFNHAWGQHPYHKIYPPLYGADGKPLPDWNPFFHQTPPAVNMWGGVDWDHFVEPTTRYFQDVVRFWLEEYGVDGFRFDWVGGVDYDARAPMRADFNPFHGISAICWAARQAKPDCILIGEFWPLEGTSPAKTAAKLARTTEMDACWSGAFHHTLEDVLNQGWQWERLDIFRALGGFREEGYTTAAQRVIFSCSHDEVRPEHELKYYAWRHVNPPSGVTRQEAALRKGLLGLIATLTSPGVPMLYAGQEFGEDTPRTIDFLPLTWSKLALVGHRQHLETVTRLIHAHRDCAALRSDHIEFLANDFARDKVVRYRRGATSDTGGAGSAAEENQPVYVALNFDERDTQVSLPLTPGRWHDVVTNRHLRVGDGTGAAGNGAEHGEETTLRLPAWSGAVWVRA